MHRQTFGLIMLSALLTALGLFDYSQHPPAVTAAPKSASSIVYLPIITRQCTTTQLARDVSFESGAINGTDWQVQSNQSSNILDSSSIPQPIPTHTGSWKAWLGGSDLVVETLWQTITIPANASNFQISFWYRVTTNEPSPLIHDQLDIQIRNNAGTVLETLYTLYDGDASTTWFQKTTSATSNYAGQSIQIAFAANADTSNATSFFVDDISVTVCQ